MLRLYADTKILNEGNRTYVFPLIFDLYFSKKSVLNQYYSLSDKMEESDIIILSLEYAFLKKNLKNYLNQFFKRASEFKKPIWIYSGGDFGNSLNDDNIYNFRLSGFKSKLNENTIILPSFVSDPYNNNLQDNFRPLKKEPVPNFGFVGHAKSGLLKFVKELLIFFSINIKRLVNIEYADYQPFYPSSVKRAKYLNYLQSISGIQTNFIFRDKYRAGIKAKEDKAFTTKEFFKNIYDNPYTFCMRGGGNFSVRFYEILAVGRIPVLLNTDCLLPLDELINWQKHCVILDESEYRSLGNKIVKFHKDLSEEEFIGLQKRNRKLWEDYLTRHSFFKIIHDIFLAKINKNEA